MSTGLFEELNKYSKSNYYPFHMPGHKRNPQSGALAHWYALDITEIEGFDNLHQPEGLIRDAQQRAAQLYGSEESYFLINGSTAGILSAVSALSGHANKLIIARNCHKAVYHAAFLNHMELQYVYPEVLQDYDMAGQITAQAVQEAIESILQKEKPLPRQAHEIIAGVVITSPSYDGIVSDVSRLAELVHSYGLPLLVDQAHGAHFGLHPAFPENAVKQGADVVIHSMHKTLAAPTQTALLHRNGKLVSGEVLRKYLSVYQSSSPSYLLMAGIDEAVRIAEQEGAERLTELLKLRSEFIHKIQKCQWIRICPYTEPGKLVISVKKTSMTGQQLLDVLRIKYRLQMEMAAGNYVVAILSMMDTKEGFERLAYALLEIDAQLGTAETDCILPVRQPQAVLPMWKAYGEPGEEVELETSQGRLSAGFINLYPPGIPLIVPGESITKEMLDVIYSYIKHEYNVQGIENNKIKVIRR